MKLYSLVLSVCSASLVTLVRANSLPFGRDAAMEAIETFAYDVLHKVDLFHENIIFGNLGVAMALGLILKGANGQTAAEIQKVLHLNGIAHEDWHAKLLKLLNTEVERPRDDVTLTVSNLVLASKDVPVKAKYVEFIRKNYHAWFDLVDFANDDGSIVRTVNEFVSNGTKGVVPSLLKEPFSKTTQMSVVNTVYFQGIWKTPFPRANTHRAPFYNTDGTVTQVDMMHVITDVETCRIPGLNGSLIHIHFKGNVIMNLVKPDNVSGSDALISHFNKDIILQCEMKTVKTRVNLYLPRFRLDNFCDMKDLFTKLGARSMFDPKKADLTRITDIKPFALSSAMARYAINIDEDGANAEKQAESETRTFSAEHDSNIETFRVDHPFGFAIYDNVHKFVIFGDIINNL